MFQILITDNDKHTRHYLSALLSDAGYTPRCASSAGEALKLIKEIPFDLLIVDVMMPGMDGYEFTRLLRDCRYDLPILMLSARQLPDNIKHGFLGTAAMTCRSSCFPPGSFRIISSTAFWPERTTI